MQYVVDLLLDIFQASNIFGCSLDEIFFISHNILTADHSPLTKDLTEGGDEEETAHAWKQCLSHGLTQATASGDSELYSAPPALEVVCCNFQP